MCQEPGADREEYIAEPQTTNRHNSLLWHLLPPATLCRRSDPPVIFAYLISQNILITFPSKHPYYFSIRSVPFHLMRRRNHLNDISFLNCWNLFEIDDLSDSAWLSLILYNDGKKKKRFSKELISRGFLCAWLGSKHQLTNFRVVWSYILVLMRSRTTALVTQPLSISVCLNQAPFIFISLPSQFRQK